MLNNQTAEQTASHVMNDVFQPDNCSISFRRMGYGAMQLAGPHVWGPPKDRPAARAVLREAVALGVNHIDTADFYGPHVTNEIIREALFPYAKDLTIVTKIGFIRGSDSAWLPAHSRQALTEAIHDNLRRLGLEAIDVVNLRAHGLAGPEGESIGEAMTVLADLRKEGLIRYIGLSNVNAEQVAEAQKIAEIVCVQNHYNVIHRADDALVDTLAAQGIAYVPFFPLGGFSPVQSEQLNQVAQELDSTPMQVALAWLLQRSPNILVIPGTSSLTHLRENTAAAGLTLNDRQLARLNALQATSAKP